MRCSNRLILAFMLLQTLAVTGCVSPSKTDSKENAKTSLTPSPDALTPKWEKTLTQFLEDPTPASTEAYGLFSAGGMTDQGQTLVFLGKEANLLFVVNPGSKRLDMKRSLSAKEVQEFTKGMATAAGLKDQVGKGFDGVRYQLVHVRKDEKGKAEIVKRINYAPLPKSTSKGHDSLLASFRKLTGV